MTPTLDKNVYSRIDWRFTSYNLKLMQLLKIDKSTYKKRLNIITIALVAALALLSVGFGSLLIANFGAQQGTTESTGNFHLNLIGVIAAAIVCASAMSFLKETPYFHEVYYVWRLKALQNRIYRKLKGIKERGASNDRDALIILNFYYRSLKEVYLLDNNTLTLPELETNISQIQQQIEDLNLEISIDDFNDNLLK
jgi:hypothetical protein